MRSVKTRNTIYFMDSYVMSENLYKCKNHCFLPRFRFPFWFAGELRMQILGDGGAEANEREKINGNGLEADGSKISMI